MQYLSCSIRWNYYRHILPHVLTHDTIRIHAITVSSIRVRQFFFKVGSNIILVDTKNKKICFVFHILITILNN